MLKTTVLVSLLFISNIYGKDIVLDKDTGLIWQYNSDIKELNYNEAIKYCSNLTLGGYNDWRLPNIDELYSITDDTRYNPAIKDIFKNVKNSYYWSSTKTKWNSSRGWVIRFRSGYDFNVDLSDLGYVRCVR